MTLRNLITTIKLPFCKERQLYRSFYAILGFYPRRLKLYKQALMHKSAVARTQSGGMQHNERLEFLGDAILEAVVSDILYRHFDKKQEGFLTVTRSNIVKRETLGQIAIKMGLDKLLKSACTQQNHNSYLEGNAFEAIIGAIYLDQGYKRCVWFVKEKMLKPYISLDKMAYKDVNYKSKLLEWGQKHKFRVFFELLSEDKDESGAPIFHTRVRVEGIECGNGSGFSKKESQQVACKQALNSIKEDKSLFAQIECAHLATVAQEQETLVESSEQESV